MFERNVALRRLINIKFTFVASIDLYNVERRFFIKIHFLLELKEIQRPITESFIWEQYCNNLFTVIKYHLEVKNKTHSDKEENHRLSRRS